MSNGERFKWLCMLHWGKMQDTCMRVSVCVERVPTAMMPTIATDGTTGGEEGGELYFLRRGDGGGGGNDDAPIHRIRCACNFFLYKMVRRIVGMLVAVGGGDTSLDALRSCLGEYNYYYYHSNPNDRMQNNDGTTTGAKEGKKKPAVPPKLLNTAPAKGLCLEHIEHDKGI